MLMSRFGTTFFVVASLLFSLISHRHRASHQQTLHGHIFREAKGMKEYGYLESSSRGNPNCAYKCVPSCGVEVQGNGHLKSQPGCGLH